MTYVTKDWDFWELLWPQIFRGIGLMLAIVPITNVALGTLAPERVKNASGLFNLMRNLGGAIGLAVVNTLIQSRTPAHVAALVERLQAGDIETARFVGLPLDQFTGQPIGPVDEATRDLVAPLVEHAGLTMALNEAWLLLGAFTLVSLLAAPWLRRPRL
jgi:DHA2 family multidrug resistance protein